MMNQALYAEQMFEKYRPQAIVEPETAKSKIKIVDVKKTSTATDKRSKSPISATRQQSLLNLSRTDSLLSGTQGRKPFKGNKSRSRSAKHEESRVQSDGFTKRADETIKNMKGASNRITSRNSRNLGTEESPINVKFCKHTMASHSMA